LKQRETGPAVFRMALGVSLAMHAGAAGYWFYAPPSGNLGSVDVPTNAISVNLETTDVIDALESAAARQASSSPAGMQAQAVETKAPETATNEEEKPPPKAEKAEEKTEEPQVARPSEQAALEQKPEPQQEKDSASEEEEQKKKKQQASVPGGAGTTGAEEAEASAGRVSASEGSILNYGAKLRAMISSHAPRNIRGKTLRIAFNVAPAGGLISVHILESSHDEAVDRKVIEFVRNLSASLPPPPEGATPTQLAFNIKIKFR
jgi:periplasmic protein TonB